MLVKKKQKYPRNRPCRPVGFLKVKDLTLSRQSAQRWRLCCQHYAPAALYTQKYLSIPFC
jgi:hypothetical protein